MAKRISALFVMVLLAAGVLGWLIAGPGTGFGEKSKSFIIAEGKTDKSAVLQVLSREHIISGERLFSAFGSMVGIWDRIKPGKYEVKKGQSVWSIAKMLRNGRLAEVKLVINGIRVKENMARLIGKNFSTDSAAVMQFLNSNDSLKPFGVDTNTVFSMIIPDTYSFYWNTPLSKIFKKLYENNQQFWQNKDRLAKAKAIGLTPEEVYTLASIVEEETNYESDRYKIASVYLNRLTKSMPLQACPTIKYAMKDFSLTRIYNKYLSNPSPYNTYRRKGLPPGPICIPSPKTIDVVLNAPKTDYLFFVAKSDFSGYHHFSSDFKEHSQYAKEYQKQLDIYMAQKQHK